MVKLELYRVFREVAEAGNISLAAENLYLSQSAVSQSVKQLEQQLGTRLFLRSPRGVTLTEDGRLLFEYVRSAMGLLETGEDKLQQSRTLQAGTLVIGASDTVTSQFLLPHLDAFHRRYPNIHIRIISGRSYKVLGESNFAQVDRFLRKEIVNDKSYANTLEEFSSKELSALILGAFFGLIFQKMINDESFTNPDETSVTIQKFIKYLKNQEELS